MIVGVNSPILHSRNMQSEDDHTKKNDNKFGKRDLFVLKTNLPHTWYSRDIVIVSQDITIFNL